MSALPQDIVEVLRARKKAWKVPELTELLNLGQRTLYPMKQGLTSAFLTGG